LHARPPHKIRGVAQDTLSWDARYASCTKLISASPTGLDICDIDIWDTGICNIGIRNIRTTTRFRIRLFPKHMEAQGFVSKNDRLEKADCQAIKLGGGRCR
jgi:hypothetical protein